MSHDIDKEDLSAYLDGELPAPRRTAVESHLESCGECREELARIKRAQTAFRAHGRLPAPAGLERSLRRPAPSRERLGFALAAGLVALALLLSGKAFKPQINAVFNQIMGMISGAASTVGSGK
ncbi:MAG TPA: zf-HC2 domain-containing protein [Elusimicrobiota bacterium]|jgi:anti-sigma factor RsiW|nr:zf-HC2 domain-containing protein [Elusimicrobiota bacterium]